MIDDYINIINQKKEKERIKEEVLFGQGLGTIIVITSFLNFLSTTSGIIEILAKIGLVLGVLLISFGVVFPYILYYPSQIMKKLINKVFEIMFLAILTVLYIIFIIPIGIATKRKWGNQYGFVLWDKAIVPESIKGFTTKSDERNLEQSQDKRNGKLNSILNVIGYFMQRKQFILIPILCVLIFVGLLFFFVTSGVVTPMIYTLF